MPINLNNTGNTGGQTQPTSTTPRRTMTVSEYNQQNPNAQWGADTKVAFSYGGKTYALNDQQYNWIKSRYKDSWADSYGYDVEDQQAKAAGRMSSSVYNSYKNNGIDYQLRELGLPSVGKLESYLGAYDKWHTGTVDQRYKGVPNEQWTKMSEFYKNKWTYEDTTEDQLRKLNGQMPKALLSKYQDNELDESLMARNLPPAAELYKYGEQYMNYQGINAFYANVAGRWTELRMNNELDENGNYLKNDDTVYRVNGKEVTGRELFTDAFYDELLSPDDQGNYKYANILPLFKNNHVYESEQKASEDYNIYRGKEVLALGKGENLSDDYSNYEAFSYDNFESQYGDYFSKYFANMQAYNVDGTPAKFDDGSAVTISDALAAFDKVQTEKERKEFYSIDKLASEEDDSSVSAFLRRWRNANPTKGYLDMFNDMRTNGVDEKNIKAAKDQVLKSARNMGKDEVKLVKEAWASFNASAPQAEKDMGAGGVGGKNYATKEEADLAIAKQIFIDSFDSDMLMRHMGNDVTAESVKETASYFTEKGIGSVALSQAMKDAKAAYVANTDSVDENVIKAFDSAIEKDKRAEYSKYKADYMAFKRDAISAAVDPSTISTSELYITNRVNVLGGEVTPDVLYQIVKSTAELSWSNKYSVKEALLNLGFTDDGEFTDPERANEWTKNWTDADKIRFRDLLKQNGYRSVNELENKPDTTPEWEEPTKDEIALMKDSGYGKDALVDSMYKYVQSHGGWHMEDRNASITSYYKSLGLSEFAINDALLSLDWRYLRGDYKESPSLGNTEDYLKSQFSPDDTLAAGDYQIARDWMDKMIADGELTPFEAYNVLCGEGLQDEIMAFDADGWHKAIYEEKIVPEMFNVADGTTKLYWESLTPEDQRLKAEELWNALTDEQRDAMFADYDWRYDPSIYRTAEQAWSQQLIATLPSVVTNIKSGAIGFADAVASIVSGDQDMWDVTKNAFAENQQVASFGAVTDGVNGAQVAQLATDATAELVKMYTLGAVGGGIANKIGGATGLATIAESPFSTKGVQKFAGMAIDLLKASPFSMMATGNAYAEAKTAGASNAEALPYAFIVGGLEGIIESFNVDKIWGEVLGNGAFGKMLVEGQGLYKAASVVAKARLASIPVAFLGEATEEGLSYMAEALWKTVATYSGSEWAKDFEFSWKELGEQMLMGGITGALGATLGSSQITKDSIMLDYYRNNGKVTAAIGDADMSATWWSTYSNEQQLTYRKGGWRIMNLSEFSDTVNRMQENWRTLHSVNENDPESIPNMQQAYERLKASEDAKVNTLTTELNNLRAEMKGLNPYDQDYKNDMKRLTAQIVSKENALADAKTKRAANLRASETAITSKKAQAEAQYSSALNKMNAHFAGIYLRNESAIKAKKYDSIEANMANARVNGDDFSKPGVTSQNAPVDVSQEKQYNNKTAEEANENGRQGTEEGTANEGQPGQYAGVPGQTFSGDNQVLSGEGRNGRANSRWFESVPITEKARAKGIDPVDLRTDNNDPSSFYTAIGDAKASNDHGAFVDQHSVDEYGNMQTFMSDDGGVGVAVKDDGDIVSVFKNPEKNQSKKSSTSILFTALENGGKKLDNFNSNVLSQIYLQHGFIPVARIAFNDDYAPDGWNYERDGRPDILFWVHNGDDADTILEKMGTYEMPDIENLPLFEGENAYDEAKAYRDSLVNENTGWTNQSQETSSAPMSKTDDKASTLTDGERSKIVEHVKRIGYRGTLSFINDPEQEFSGRIKNGDITLNLAYITSQDAKELKDNPGFWVLKHEFTHFIENAKTYNEFFGAVRNQIVRELGGEGFTRAIDDYKKAAADAGHPFKNDEAVERDIVADYVGRRLFTSKEAIDSFVREQEGAASRVYNWLRYVIDRGKLRRQKNAGALRVLEAERMYAQAFRAANKTPSAGDVDYSTPGINYDIVSSRYGANGDATQATDDMLFSTPGLNYDELVRRYGAKPQGREPRARDVKVPNMANDNARVSDFTQSVMESAKANDTLVDEIQGEIASDVDEIRKRWAYIPKSNDETMRAAKEYIAQVQPTEAKQELHDMVMSGKYSLKAEAIGLQLLADAAERNDWQAVKEIAIDLRVLATDAGQRTQLFNVLKDLKGVGSAWYIENLVKKLNTWYADDIRTGKIDGPITVSQEAMDQVRAAKTQAEVEEAERAVAKEIAPQLPLKVSDKLSNWRYLSMLGNPVTHIRNVTGNTLMAGMSAIKDVVASGVQRLVEKTGLADESDRTHAWLSTADKNMWEDFAEQSYEEQRRNLQGGGKLGFQSLLKQSQRSFDNKYLDAIARGIDNGTYSDKQGFLARLIENIKNNGAMGMLEVEDAWGLKRAYKKALMEHMVAQGYTMNDNGQVGKLDSKGKFTEISTEAMNKAIDWATNQAWTATFRGPSKFASMLNDISKMNTASKMIVEGVMPFKKTPVNIAKTGGMYSPVGIIIGTTQLLTKVKQGKMSAAQAVDNLSSGLTGTALMALGVMLAKAGILRAGGEDKKKYETYLEDTGDQTYAFKFGNVSVNMSAIAPATIPLFMGVALNEMVERNDGSVDLSAITDTIAGTLNPFMEMSFMSSLNNALKSYNNDGIGGALGSAVTSALQNYGSQYLPTLGGKIAQFADPTLRSTKSSATSPLGGNADYYLRSLAKKVPGATTALQPDVDIWGRTTTKDSFGDWALDFANKFILPTNVKITNRDAVDKELIRVVESTGTTDFLPSDGNKYFTVKGQKYTMNARQYAQYSQDRGQAAYAAIKEVMASPSYVNATDDVKADMLNKAKEAAYKSVNTIWKEKLGALD